jgi:hypothetical protein
MGILGCKARRLTISESIDHTVVMLTLAIEVRVLVCRPLKCGEWEAPQAPGLPLRPRIGKEGHQCDHRVAGTPVDNP